MKTLRITLTKPGATAICINTWHFDDFTLSSTWTGDRDAFRLSRGSLPDLRMSLDWIADTVAFQAAQSGATFTIEDLGGEAIPRLDNVTP